MPDLTLTLGGIAFQDFEVPEAIRGLGGKQMLVVHKLIGGDRTIDAMGRDDTDITWSGRFRGSDAVSRAWAVDALRIAGSAVDLTFGAFALTVVIAEFVCDVERAGFEIPYSLTLVVQTDHSLDSAAQDPDVDQMLGSDNSWAQTLGGAIGDPTLTGLLTSVSSAVGAVPSFAAATSPQLASVLAPISAAQARVSTLIGTAETTLNSATSLGGVTAGLPAQKLIANLQGQAAAVNHCAKLYDLQNVL